MGVRIILLLVLIVSGIAVVGMALYTSNGQPAPAAVADQRPSILVADGVIATGALITASQLRFAPLPPDVAADQVFVRQTGGDTAAAEHKALDEVAGAVARRRFEPGEPLQRGAVVKPGDSGFLAAVLDPGMRAVTIAVTATSGTGGLIYPGDRVDVILSQVFSAQNVPATHRSAAETIAENIRVLAIDQQLQAKASPTGEGKLAQTVTLEVTPQQVEEIVVATKLGELSLTIRSLQPSQAVADRRPVGAIWADEVSPALKQVIAAERKPSPEVTGPVVMVMHGDKAEAVNFR